MTKIAVVRFIAAISETMATLHSTQFRPTATLTKIVVIRFIAAIYHIAEQRQHPQQIAAIYHITEQRQHLLKTHTMSPILQWSFVTYDPPVPGGANCDAHADQQRLGIAAPCPTISMSPRSQCHQRTLASRNSGHFSVYTLF